MNTASENASPAHFTTAEELKDSKSHMFIIFEQLWVGHALRIYFFHTSQIILSKNLVIIGINFFNFIPYQFQSTRSFDHIQFN